MQALADLLLQGLNLQHSQHCYLKRIHSAHFLSALHTERTTLLCVGSAALLRLSLTRQQNTTIMVSGSTMSRTMRAVRAVALNGR